MSTYVQVRSRIADDINRTDLNSQINQQIVAAIRHYRTFPMFFNEKTTTLSASQAYVALPADFITDDQLYIKISGYEIPMDKWPLWDIFDQRPTSGGRPGAYCIYGNRFEFNRSCDQVYTLVERYIYELSEVTLSASDDQTNEWLITGEDLIIYRAEKMIYSQILKDVPAAQRSNELEKEAFKGLMRFRDSRIGTGYAKAHYP